MVERPLAEEPAVAGTEPEPAEEAKPKTRRRPRAQKAIDKAAAPLAPSPEPEAPVEAQAKPKRRSRAKTADAEAPVPAEPEPARTPAADNDQPAEAEIGEDGEPRRGGWWQRTFG
jgi:ribonuclease E